MSGFGGKVVFVTGGGSGIGRSAALAFASAGARVAIADRDPDGGNATVTAILAAGGDAHFFATDVTDADSVAATLRAVVEQLGGLDCAFNNAGIDGARHYAYVADVEPAGWNLVIDVNLKGVWLCMRHEIAYMRQRDGGAIVNTASLAAMRGMPGFSPYVASKHAVLGLTRTAAVEYAHAGIRVNAVAPGAIRTPMFERAVASDPTQVEAVAQSNPMGRIGEPHEVAAAVLWLCSDAASFVTGQCLGVDGGYLAR